MIRNWRPYTLGALCRGTGCTPLEPALVVENAFLNTELMHEGCIFLTLHTLKLPVCLSNVGALTSRNPMGLHGL
jgi:hypothetical protein